MPSQSIIAVATAAGPAGVGILRLSGPQAVAAAQTLFRASDGRPLSHQAARTMTHGRLVSGLGAVLDVVLAVRFSAPASYTGEDVVEIHAHGGSAHLQSLLEVFLEAGARLEGGLRLAKPGEFTQRSFLAGKLDLAQAEAVADLIHSQAALARQAAGKRLQGGLSSALDGLRQTLLAVLAEAEAACDHPEEEEQLSGAARWRALLEGAAAQMDGLLAGARTGRLLREGMRVALCGAPNAGKSSLFNALLGSQRSIVHAQPGTTRDYVEAPFQIEGFPMVLVDTAGLRQGQGEVEQEGIRRSREIAREAEVRLLLVDGSSALKGVAVPEGSGELLVLRTKADLPRAWSAAPLGVESEALEVSALSGAGMEELRRRLLVLALGGTEAGELPEAQLATLRHEDALRCARSSVAVALYTLHGQGSPELVAVDARAALDAVGEIVGATTRAEVVEEIFRRFCIGK